MGASCAAPEARAVRCAVLPLPVVQEREASSAAREAQGKLQKELVEMQGVAAAASAQAVGDKVCGWRGSCGCSQRTGSGGQGVWVEGQ